jgi:hypothetical protein
VTFEFAPLVLDEEEAVALAQELRRLDRQPVLAPFGAGRQFAQVASPRPDSFFDDAQVVDLSGKSTNLPRRRGGELARRPGLEGRGHFCADFRSFFLGFSGFFGLFRGGRLNRCREK